MPALAVQHRSVLLGQQHLAKDLECNADEDLATPVFATPSNTLLRSICVIDCLHR